MKNKKRRYLSLFIAVIIIVYATATTVLAAPIETRFNNTLSASSSATISSSGLLTITNQFRGFKGKTTSGEITTYIEKKSGSTWTRVSIGQPNDQWYDVVNGYMYAGSHSFQLSSRGTYRITVKFVIYGSGGAPDIITRTVTKTY